MAAPAVMRDNVSGHRGSPRRWSATLIRHGGVDRDTAEFGFRPFPAAQVLTLPDISCRLPSGTSGNVRCNFYVLVALPAATSIAWCKRRRQTRKAKETTCRALLQPRPSGINNSG